MASHDNPLCPAAGKVQNLGVSSGRGVRTLGEGFFNSNPIHLVKTVGAQNPFMSDMAIFRQRQPKLVSTADFLPMVAATIMMSAT